MSYEKLKTLGLVNPAPLHAQRQKQKLDELCNWIDAHLAETIGWQELMGVSGLDYQAIQSLFYRHKCTTAMTWIRLRRQSQSAANDSRTLPLVMRGPYP